MAISSSGRVRPIHYLFMYLIISQTKVVVMGQQAAFRSIDEEEPSAVPQVGKGTGREEDQAASTATHGDQGVASLLRSLLSTNGIIGGDAAANMATQEAATNGASSSSSNINSTLSSDILFLLQLANQTGLDPNITNSIESQLRQGQPVGDLAPAASTVAKFLSAPSSLATSGNLKQFADKVDQAQTLRNRVAGQIPASQLRTVDSYLLTAQQLALGWIGAFPLAQLFFAVTALALAASILGLLGGIFYTVAAALNLAGAINGARTSSSTSTSSQEWYTELNNLTSTLSGNVMPLAFNEHGLNLTDTVISVLDLAIEAVQAIQSVPTALISEVTGGGTGAQTGGSSQANNGPPSDLSGNLGTIIRGVASEGGNAQTGGSSQGDHGLFANFPVGLGGFGNLAGDLRNVVDGSQGHSNFGKFNIKDAFQNVEGGSQGKRA